jgi:hypothetical protein
MTTPNTWAAEHHYYQTGQAQHVLTTQALPVVPQEFYPWHGNSSFVLNSSDPFLGAECIAYDEPQMAVAEAAAGHEREVDDEEEARTPQPSGSAALQAPRGKLKRSSRYVRYYIV